MASVFYIAGSDDLRANKLRPLVSVKLIKAFIEAIAAQQAHTAALVPCERLLPRLEFCAAIGAFEFVSFIIHLRISFQNNYAFK